LFKIFETDHFLKDLKKLEKPDQITGRDTFLKTNLFMTVLSIYISVLRVKYLLENLKIKNLTVLPIEPKPGIVLPAR